MQILLIFFLAAIVGCYGDETECEKKAENCLKDFLETLLDGSPKDKSCKVLISTIECLDRDFVPCAGDEDDIKEGMDTLLEIKNEYCNKQEDDDDIEQCIEENQEYVLECLLKSVDEVLEALADQSEAEDLDNRIQCGMIIRTGQCLFDRVSEKCGHEASMLVGNLIKESLDEEALEACKSSGVILFAGPLEEDKKKK